MQHVLSITDKLLVLGDTDSALVAAESFSRCEGTQIAHLEAGLRLREIVEPEEANRRKISRIARWHYAPFSDNRLNLIAEGVPAEDIILAGEFSTLSVDYRMGALRWSDSHRPDRKSNYLVATIHRRSNLGRLHDVAGFIASIAKASGDRVLVCSRSDNRLALFYEELRRAPNVEVLPPLSPREFFELLINAAGVVTDSAGVQQESIVGGLPVIVLRDEVELFAQSPGLRLAGELDSSETTSLLDLIRYPGRWLWEAALWHGKAQAIAQSIRSVMRL